MKVLGEAGGGNSTPDPGMSGATTEQTAGGNKRLEAALCEVRDRGSVSGIKRPYSAAGNPG